MKKELVDKLHELNKDTLMETLGITYTAYDGESLTGEMEVSPAVHQPYGLLHGGATAALAETLGSFLSAMQFAPEQKKGAVGTNLNIYHLKSARSGTVVGTAKFIRKGRTMHVLQIDMMVNGEKIAHAILTTNVIDIA